MQSSINENTAKKSYYGVKGWLIVFVVFVCIKFIISLIQGFSTGVDILLTLASLALSTLILIFLFRKKIVFRLLFVILAGLDLGFSINHIFELNPISELYWYPEYITFLIMSLVFVLFFGIYLFNSRRVKATFNPSPKALGGASSAFLIFMISFLVINVINLITTAARAGSSMAKYNQIPYISNLMAYITAIILGGLIIFFIIKRKASFRSAFIAMMIAHVTLLFIVFSYFGNSYNTLYELYSYSLPTNISAQCLYSFSSFIAWTIVIYTSKGIRSDFGLTI